MRKLLRKLNLIYKFHSTRVLFYRTVVVTLLSLFVILRIILIPVFDSDVYVVVSSGKAIPINNPFDIVYVSEEFYPGDVFVAKEYRKYITLNDAQEVYGDFRGSFWSSRMDTASTQMSYHSKKLLFGLLGGFGVPFDIREKFSSYGMAHLFAVSGTHVDATGSILSSLGLPVWGLLIVVLIYGFLVGFSPSVIRAVIFLVILTIMRSIGEKKVDVFMLGLLTCVFVFIAVPSYVFSVSFVLSLLISLSIIYSFQEQRYDIMLWTIWGLSSWYFSQISFFTLAYPLFSILFVVFLVLSIVWLIFPFNLLGQLIDGILGGIKGLPYLSFPINVYVPSYAALMFLGLIFMRNQKKIYRNIGFLFVLAVLIMHMFLLYYFPYRLAYVNVGEGDSIIISSPETNMLVDTGRPYQWVSRSVLNAVKQLGINYFDFVLLTHDDVDHTGGFEKYLHKVLERRYTSVLEGSDICGKELHFSKNFFIWFSPCFDDWSNNERSAVVYFYGNWLLADIEKRGLANFLSRVDLDSVILKIPHHGAYDNLTGDLVKELRPLYAIVSVGRNPYGHPHPNTINILNTNNVKVLRTDEYGTIVVLISRFGKVYIMPLRYWWVYALQYIL